MRPIQRPPLALVCLFDDGEETGEWFRVRAAKTVIGRSAGEISIPHDGAVSAKHAELRRELIDGEYRWFFQDLGSTNGTFARVAEFTLSHNQELLLGCRRFRFDSAPRFIAEDAVGGAMATRMLGPSPHARQNAKPALIERLLEAEGERIELPEEGGWIGSDPQQSAIVLRDPFLDPRHARIFLDPKGQWRIEDNHSRNGVWVGVDQIQVWDIAEFMVGEQRILVKIL